MLLKRKYYHVTRIENLSSIAKSGLIPQIGERAEELGEPEPAIYLFPSKSDMNTALSSWLGEWYDEHYGEDCALAFLEITLPEIMLVFQTEAAFECVCKQTIPPEVITFYDELGKKMSVCDSQHCKECINVAENDKQNPVVYFEDLVVKDFQKIQKKIKKVTPDEYDGMWLGLFDQIKVAYRKADQSYLSDGELVKMLQTLNGVLNDNTLTFPDLVQQALDYMQTIQALEMYVASGVAPQRLTERTNAIISLDSVEGNPVVCLDLCYDNDASLPVCAVECLYQEPATHSNIETAQTLLHKLAQVYKIPVFDGVPLSNKPSLSKSIKLAETQSNKRAFSQDDRKGRER